MKTKFLFIYLLIGILVLQNCKSDSEKLTEIQRNTLFYLISPTRAQATVSNSNTYQTTFLNNCKTISNPIKTILKIDAEDVYSIDDMIFSSLENAESGLTRSAFKTGCSNLWDGAVVPFEISPTFSNISSLYSAFTAWENKTPIRFIQRTNLHKDYIYITSSSGCSSYVGRSGGKQSVNLASSCSYKNILHELGHVIGFYHEHQRVDRDNFIIINTENIQADKLNNFNKLFPSYGFSNIYDINSIMHYTPYTFSANSRPTITLRDRSINFGNLGTLSTLDVENATEIYKNNFKILNTIPVGYYAKSKF